MQVEHSNTEADNYVVGTHDVSSFGFDEYGGRDPAYDWRDRPIAGPMSAHDRSLASRAPRDRAAA